ncbi:SusC/RagA family TonB-linked outer membrane protein [Algoriphagus boritolerans]|uniref:TonB-linked outer membrane protein, SusC/RagA family n=1 Tax=Algoriphagus boritolerans DSM 17298 = JCM 18970 TaxID=1120964 RepID=A0A1H6A424_9BACT|nr:TonB-dependent receptor [Algoriphagus boritolerans]SEG42486.1 TonB-linked outer membrane protein, SusC/RagA family [Algoriphagus boritolerans DSM 17298 = JCM 18970]
MKLNFTRFSKKFIEKPTRLTLYKLLSCIILQVFLIQNVVYAAYANGNTSSNSLGGNHLVLGLILYENTSAALPFEVQVTGKVVDEKGESLPGTSVTIKGTTQGTVTDLDGTYSILTPEGATLVFSYIGFETIEVPVNNRSQIDITLKADVSSLDEVVVVGYGTQKKINLTGAVSTAKGEDLANRPVTNMQQALQGLVSNLVITPNLAGGEPGADMAMSIRGLASFEGSTAPFVLVDGVPMNLNDIDPNDVESVSVLKDVAATSIYGARAAYGVILITTKRGSTGSRISFSSNVGFSEPTIWPRLQGGMDWAHALNDANTNFGGTPPYPTEALQRLERNLANPGSAPGMLPLAGADDWNILNTGTFGVANDGISDLLMRDRSMRQKYNLALSGGNESINYYLSTGYYTEDGLLRFGDESFNRFNVDAKIAAKLTKWMNVEFITKYKSENENFPWNPDYGRAWYMNWLSKIKFGTPAKYPDSDIWTLQTRVEEWKNMRQEIRNNQIVLSPKIDIEPIKGWVTTAQFNFTSEQIEDTRFAKQFPWVRPSGEIALEPQSRQATQYLNDLIRNNYFSPNIYSSYAKEIGKHDFRLMVGYQHEVWNYSNLYARSFFMLSDAVPSVSTSVGDQFVRDAKGHWSTQSLFSRLNYIFNKKYLLEVNVRQDGSSRFEPSRRTGVFPSASAGWIISQEEFLSSSRFIDLLKVRGSYGKLGNQDVANYLYVPTLPIRQTNQWLFGNERAWAVGAPNLNSVNLSWETILTKNLGIDMAMFGNRLDLTFEVYETNTEDLVSPGSPLPAVLGSPVPKRNEGEIRTRGWELELGFKGTIGSNFKYQIRGQVADYKSVVINYTNQTGLLSTFYKGQVLGEIWGYRYDGHYQNQQEINEGVNQSFIFPGRWRPGDFRYKDLNEDGRINIGDNTVNNPGDLTILGNTTPRFTYGLNLGGSWKNFDLSIFFQGVARRDWSFGQSAVFRGPAAGPMHNNVLEGHMDYWRDESSALGPNYNAYFPKPYAQFFGENQKNYGMPTDHLLQNAAYLRLKNLQIGYSIPKHIAKKALLTNARAYFSAENLLTFTNLMFFDPEALAGRWYGSGDAYPLSKTFSAGINLNF